MNKSIFPNKCHNCEYWTIHEIISTDPIIFECSHCGYKGKMSPGTNLSSFLKNLRTTLKGMEKIYPKIRELQDHGDYIKL